MMVITVSRQLGSRGGEIGARVAEALGLQFVDREIIRQAAQEAAQQITSSAALWLSGLLSSA